jgi:hypothetical protein
MAVDKERHHAQAGRSPRPLDTARSAFDWLVTGPHPVSIDGRLFAGLPRRSLPLNEVRDRLLHPSCSQTTRDAVWAHLVARSRTEGATWTLGCVGVALPALTRITARLSARFAGDVSDIHAAVLTGFLTELAHIELHKPRIMLRLRWAAYRAGHTAVRDALDAPVPAGSGFGSPAPALPSGHPDFVLARAVAEGVLTASEAELIGATRLEGLPLATVAQARGTSYPTAHQARRRAERRLVAYLLEHAPTEDERSDPATQVLQALTITTAAGAATTPEVRSRSVIDVAEGAPQKARVTVSKKGPDTGVQGCGTTPATPAPTTPTDAQSPQTPEVPRCA